jgi:hypothetical protein
MSVLVSLMTCTLSEAISARAGPRTASSAPNYRESAKGLGLEIGAERKVIMHGLHISREPMLRRLGDHG